ncbi:MAG: glycosyltransferase family 4 protein [Casimicrobiaceae bacterium]
MATDANDATRLQAVAIAIVGPLPPPSGGMANQTQQLVRLLREGGLAAEVLQVNAPYHPRWVARLRGVRAIFRLVPYVMALWRGAGRVQLFHVMANSGWAWHFFAAPAIWIARLRGIPAVVNYRGGEAAAFMQRQSAWVRPSLRMASALIVPSAFLRRVFGRWALDTDIVPNIVDLARFTPGPVRSAGIELLVARNLEVIYDIGTALRAFALVRLRHPDARLTVAGSGPRREDLERLAKELGIGDGVVFTGRLDNEQMAAQYRAASIALNPSLADNMPISLLEAMASGTPIVTTNVGGIPDLVEDGITGLLVPPGDPAAMASAVLRLTEDPTLAAELRAAGIEAARSYTWGSVRPQLFAVYARALQANALAGETAP